MLDGRLVSVSPDVYVAFESRKVSSVRVSLLSAHSTFTYTPLLKQRKVLHEPAFSGFDSSHTKLSKRFTPKSLITATISLPLLVIRRWRATAALWQPSLWFSGFIEPFPTVTMVCNKVILHVATIIDSNISFDVVIVSLHMSNVADGSIAYYCTCRSRK
ncbi:hypothetical protein BC829DRAFT_395574 [Chytridium lagenaria]|nr:hypothetical protein BC829DRAFT_395574 [Chytridium lagenaria]